MVQCGDGPCFALEAVTQVPVVRKVFRQEFQGNETAKALILRLINDAHAALSQFFQDLIMRNELADHRGNSAVLHVYGAITTVRLKIEENQLVNVFGEIGVFVDRLEGA